MIDRASASGSVDVNGTRLHFESRGSGPTLLLLHGFTLDLRMWAPQLESLSSAFRVVAYDARGFGHSALPTSAPYRHCDDAAALIEALRLAPVVAVGHSIGGHQLLELALARPELVSGYVGVCTSGLASVPFPPDVMQLFADVRNAARTEGIAQAKRLWSRGGWFATAREEPRLARLLDAILDDYSGWHWQNDNPARNIEPPVAARLGELAIPTLLIDGALDLPYNHEVARAVASAVPGATLLEVPGASHMANLEAPGAVNDAIGELARRVKV
jgi:3-oxoadipate enol-lactonase